LCNNGNQFSLMSARSGGRDIAEMSENRLQDLSFWYNIRILL
jgi:hypothetical protein